MATKIFDMQDVLKSGWEGFKKNPVVLIGLLLVSIASYLLVGTLFSFLPPIILSLLSTLVTSYIMLSMLKAVLLISKGEEATWAVLKNDINAYLRFFVATLILSIIFIIATILLFFPLVLALAVFFPVPFLIVDKKEIPIIEAFKRSWAITTPQFLSCIIYIIVMFILAIIGMLLLGVGLFVAVPVIYISGAIIYKKLYAAVYDDSAAQ